MTFITLLPANAAIPPALVSQPLPSTLACESALGEDTGAMRRWNKPAEAPI